MIKIVIADDHEIYRDGLKMVLKKEKTFSVVGEAKNGKELLDIVFKENPDVIITDIVMPEMDGIAAMKEIITHKPNACCIALSMFNEETMIVEMLEAGALGYLLKNAEKEEIFEAVKSVVKNQPYYCRTTSAKLVTLISKSRFNPYKNRPQVYFAEREVMVIKLICQEKNNSEISKEMFVSARTIEGYRRKIMNKMGVKGTAGIAVYAIKTGIVKITDL
ncbi:MAG: response regulator transcription factor [Chitinophagaceae bacterium]|jgi:DNA-binding NarL/FixJ family response regulator|nr:response regulator transcription factor [Chitinophagaceae bacterium]